MTPEILAIIGTSIIILFVSSLLIKFAHEKGYKKGRGDEKAFKQIVEAKLLEISGNRAIEIKFWGVNEKNILLFEEDEKFKIFRQYNRIFSNIETNLRSQSDREKWKLKEELDKKVKSFDILKES